MPVEGVVFDPGAWNDYPGHKYREYKSAVFPTQEPPASPTTTAWDISHARRYVDVFTALVRDAKILHLEFPSQIVLRKLANQFTYSVFNGNFELPLFSNFWDGVDGWYRVNYAKRLGYGYAPGDLSIAALGGGYAFLASGNEDMKQLYIRLFEMVTTGSVSEKDWLKKHFSGNRYKNYQRFRLPLFIHQSLDEMNTTETILFLDFIPSLCRIHGLPMKNIILQTTN